jgi:Ras-related protein Rab-1A
MTTSYYRGAHGIVLVYDITSGLSFASLQSWMQEINRYLGENVKKVVIGNKVDLESQREVSTEQLKKFAERYNMPYLETSAKDATNVEKVFSTIAEAIIVEAEGHNTVRESDTIRIELGDAVSSPSLARPGYPCGCASS